MVRRTMTENTHVDITALKAVTRLLSDCKSRKSIADAGYGNGVPVVAVAENETVREVEWKMNATGSAKVILGIYFPGRSEKTTIARYRKVQIVLSRKTPSKDVPQTEDFEMFHDISPESTIGMYCDYLWQKPERTVGIPDFAGVKGFVPSRKSALVMV